MKKTIKKLWTAALTSGEYKQVRGNLHTSNGYCVFGVLVDLHRKIHKGKWKFAYNSALSGRAYSYHECVGLVPPSVLKWAGLKLKDPSWYNVTVVNGLVSRRSLIQDNDTYGCSFKTLAKTIDKHF